MPASHPTQPQHSNDTKPILRRPKIIANTIVVPKIIDLFYLNTPTGSAVRDDRTGYAYSGKDNDPMFKYHIERGLMTFRRLKASKQQQDELEFPGLNFSGSDYFFKQSRVMD